MKKQSFKNRKKTGGTGGNDEKEVTAPVVQEESAPVVKEESVPVEAPVEEEKNTSGEGESVEQNDTSNDQNITPEDGNISTSSQEANVENNSDSTQQGDSDETITPTVEELQSEPVTTEDENALKQVNDLKPDEINKLVQEIANNPDAPIPSWARAAIKSGAVGPLVEYLNNNTELKTALEKRVIDAIQNSGSSGPGGPVATSENTPLGTETNTDNIQKKYEDWIGQLANNNNSDGIKGILSDCVFVPISKITYIQDDNKKWIDPINSSGASTTVEMSSTDNDAGAGTTAATGPDNAPGNTSDASTTETSSAGDAANVETDTSGDTAGDTAGAADNDTSAGNSANTEMSSTGDATTGDATTGDATTTETNAPATTTTSEPPQ